MDDPNDPAYLFIESLNSPLSEIGCSGAAAAQVSSDSQVLIRIPSRYVEDAVAGTGLSTCFVSFLSDSNQILVHELLGDNPQFQILDDDTILVRGQNATTYVFTKDQ